MHTRPELSWSFSQGWQHYLERRERQRPRLPQAGGRGGLPGSGCWPAVNPWMDKDTERLPLPVPGRQGVAVQRGATVAQRNMWAGRDHSLAPGRGLWVPRAPPTRPACSPRLLARLALPVLPTRPRHRASDWVWSGAGPTPSGHRTHAVAQAGPGFVVGATQGCREKGREMGPGALSIRGTHLAVAVPCRAVRVRVRRPKRAQAEAELSRADQGL